MSVTRGRHFLHIPGPSPVPDRILRAIDQQTIDHRGPAFATLGKEVLEGMKRIFKTKSPVVIYPASGTGAWEAALANLFAPGDKVLMYETGQFASLWNKMANRLCLDVELITSNWRHGAEAQAIEAALKADKAHKIKAVCVVHNETSTGVTSNIPAVRAAIDAAHHPALFLVDTISGLAVMDYCHDEWGVDVSISGSQKGLMMPPGISFNALSDKAIEAASKNKTPRSFWAWDEMLSFNKTGYFPYTPATNMLFGLKEAIAMLEEEGLQNVFARHVRLGEAARLAVKTWGLEILCENPAEYSNVLTTILMPEGHDSDALRKVILEHFDMSLGAGLGKVAKVAFRIGHLGDVNDLQVIAALAGIEMGLSLADVPHKAGGVAAAMDFLAKNTKGGCASC